MIYLALTLVAAPAFDFAAATAAYKTTMSQLVAADTTNPPGNEGRATTIIAARLKKEGIASEVSEFGPGRKNIVARLKGSGKDKPLILLGHTDVVGADGQQWSTPPHTLTEKDGYYYGRGVRDDLSMVVSNLEVLILLKRSGVKLRRDVVFVATGDEESGGSGVKALLKHDPSLAEASLVLNEGGGVTNNGAGTQPIFTTYEVAQKIYQDFVLTTTGMTGHSAMPPRDNAINRLARALERLDGAEPPPRLLDATRAYFKARAKVEQPQIAEAMNAIADARGALPREAVAVLDKNPLLASLLRTTCVPTLLQSGTKANALPASATANINCRILPDETIEQTQARLAAIIGDPEVKISLGTSFDIGPPSPITGELPEALAKVFGEVAPNAPIIPMLVPGGTDARFFRQKGVAAYGWNAIASAEADAHRMHGVDERLQVAAVEPGLELYMKLVLELAQER
jgi:acetylornithine deacetylase/succinyl-diaminopimelate desuccinylase-like protein